MKSFDYQRPETIEEAIKAANKPGASYYAGGTNLLDLMKAGVRTPDSLVDITRLDDLKRIEPQKDGSLRIGALVRNSDLARNADILSDYPAIVEALLSAASGQLRNSATVGGNLMQQPRCAYFYDPHSACNLHEVGEGCDALEGETGKHAVLGWTKTCIAVHPSDFCVPLAAIGARVVVDGPDGSREISIDEFYTLPSSTQPPGSALKQGEIITAIILPSDAKRFAPRARYIKLRDRTSYAFAIVSAAAMLHIGDGRIKDARIALGGVAAKPWRAREAEDALNGAEANEASFRKAADAALADARPSGDNAHKIELARRILVRALKAAADGTPPKMPDLPGSVFAVGKEAR
ncbi:FAD binding domain-containing protein [Henriciella marina]|uniref:FAD binding domain-containing protein n=1 Tax=Henriciella marina TaxID=453851 RepID=UPI00035D2000|nr:xanthine dehydrogenase family protein subunit M [Henriciella marina]